MEVRTMAPHDGHHRHAHQQSAWVDTSIPKVAETPLEGSEEEQTFGPFNTEMNTNLNNDPTMSTTAETLKTATYKKVVRFVGPSPAQAKANAGPYEDPIEKAFDSMFLFWDDVREQASTPRGDGTDGELNGFARGCVSAVNENVDFDFKQTLDCMAERACRNPCAEMNMGSLSVQPPVDLMLSTSGSSRGEERDGAEDESSAGLTTITEMTETTKSVASATPAAYALLQKENSVKDFSETEDEDDIVEQTGSESMNLDKAKATVDEALTQIQEIMAPSKVKEAVASIEAKQATATVAPTPVKAPTKPKEVAAAITKDKKVTEAITQVREVKETLTQVKQTVAPTQSKEAKEEEKEELAYPSDESTIFVPSYSPVDTIADKLRTLIPEDILQQMVEAFIIKTGEVKPNMGITKSGKDADPIVEAIDSMILFFDDVQTALAEQKMDVLAHKMSGDMGVMCHNMSTDMESMTHKMVEDFKAAIDTQLTMPSMTMPAMTLPSMAMPSIIADLSTASAEQLNVSTGEDSGVDGSEDTTKTTNAVKIKPASMQMRTSDWVQAAESAAQILSDSATPEELAQFSKEELHRRALEKIMSERPEMEEGFSEYKTQEELLQHLMPEEKQEEIKQAIMEEKEEEEAPAPVTATPKATRKEVAVLGHSATLTPIPESDEASAATPAATDAIDQSVANKGPMPVVPLAPDEESAAAKEAIHKVSRMASLADDSVDEDDDGVVEESKTMETEENDPIVKIIDGMYLCYDDVQERKTAACAGCTEGCIGSTVPDDLEESSDDILADEGSEEKTEEDKEAAKQTREAAEAQKVEQAKQEALQQEMEDKKAAEEILNHLIRIRLEPRPDRFTTPEDRGQQLINEALQVIMQASRADASAAAQQTMEETAAQMTQQPAVPVQDVGKPEHPAHDLVDQVSGVFSSAKDRAEVLQVATSKLAEVQSMISDVSGAQMTEAEKDREIARLVDAAFQESDKLRKTWRLVIDHPGLKGVEDGMTPQMSSEMDQDKQQTKLEFEIPEMMKKQQQEPCIDWAGDDSELMASINADRKLSEMEHVNIFRDVSRGLQASSGGIITAPAFTEGNSSSAEQSEERFENPTKAALKVLGVVSVRGESDGKKFEGWTLTKKREEMLRSKLANS